MGVQYYNAYNHAVSNSLSHHCSAVAARALKIHTDTVKRMEDADMIYHNVSPLVTGGTVGPFKSRLNALGPIKGLVVGSFGEMSSDLHALLKLMAKVGVSSYGKYTGALNLTQAEASMRFYIKSYVAMVCLRAKADLLLDRVEFLVPSAGRRGASAFNRNIYQNVYSFRANRRSSA